MSPTAHPRQGRGMCPAEKAAPADLTSSLGLPGITAMPSHIDTAFTLAAKMELRETVPKQAGSHGSNCK